MQINQAIILAGGFGTRLRSEVSDLPKCMAPVAGKPFMHWVLSYLQARGISSFVFSLGYMHEKIEDYISGLQPAVNALFSVEKTPLGTGGAIAKALQLCTDEHVLVVNGDTLFETDITRLAFYHLENKATCTLSLKPVENADRYGLVDIDDKGNILSFSEKRFVKNGLINGGVYLIDRAAFQKTNLPEVSSFEKDYLEKYVGAAKLIGVIDEGYFIDIGIPEDFKKANDEINKKYVFT